MGVAVDGGVGSEVEMDGEQATTPNPIRHSQGKNLSQEKRWIFNILFTDRLYSIIGLIITDEEEKDGFVS
ncbi:MAG: hypothetical protein ANABAC_2657 [Anaerolineae bacterium]|nr:MAG: hypothetical protein ANABAC_2657 [Anaerolineae bacterium]